MTTESKKNAMAKANGLTEERRAELIRKRVRGKYHPADELAILRKAVAYLFDVVARLDVAQLENEEFKHYHEEIEKMKAEETSILN